MNDITSTSSTRAATRQIADRNGVDVISKRRRQVRLVFRAANDVSEEAIRNLINGGLAEMIAAYIGGKLARNRHAGTVAKERRAAKPNLKSRTNEYREY
jgi:hypothetical protein